MEFHHPKNSKLPSVGKQIELKKVKKNERMAFKKEKEKRFRCVLNEFLKFSVY